MGGGVRVVQTRLSSVERREVQREESEIDKESGTVSLGRRKGLVAANKGFKVKY